MPNTVAMFATVASPALWAAFFGFVAICMAIDLGMFGRRDEPLTVKAALVRSVIWVSLALAFGGWVWFEFGATRGLEFYTGYVIEQALSVDNVFVFLIVFAAFRVPLRAQQRVLFWGVLGAIVFRGIFVFLGAALVQRFHWVMLVFGAILVYSGIKLLRQGDEDVDPSKNSMVRLFKRLVPVAEDAPSEHFTTRRNGKLYATPLLVVLVAVEATDIIFAVDSVPAIFAITQDPFIVLTSNIFAILGLRSLFFVVSGAASKFSQLKVGLSLVLVFVGGKMLVGDRFPIPIGVSLGVVALLIGGSMVASIIVDRRARAALPDATEQERLAAERQEQLAATERDSAAR